MIRTREIRVERQIARAVRAAVKTDRRARAPARNIFIDRLANTGLELNHVSWQIDHYVALLPVYGIQLDSKFCSSVIGLPATVSSHASHISRSTAYRRETETFNVRTLTQAPRLA